MRTWRGYRIQKTRYDQATKSGFARLNLAPAYPDDAGILTYTRDFYFDTNRLLVRDTVISRNTHEFKYWFNTFRRHKIEQPDTGVFHFSGIESALIMKITGPECEFSINDTDVVWAYGNEQDDEPFKHLEVKLKSRSDAFIIEFLVEPIVKT